jgi:hypothetical protein
MPPAHRRPTSRRFSGAESPSFRLPSSRETQQTATTAPCAAAGETINRSLSLCVLTLAVVRIHVAVAGLQPRPCAPRTRASTCRRASSGCSAGRRWRGAARTCPLVLWSQSVLQEWPAPAGRLPARRAIRGASNTPVNFGPAQRAFSQLRRAGAGHARWPGLSP